jgi:ribosomal protein L37AE/L43A
MDLNIKRVDEELVTRFKRKALESGKTLKAWALGVLQEAANGELHTGRGEVQAAPVEERDVQSVREETDEEAERPCPDCGKPLSWNKVLRWWECGECGYHGKKERG